MGEFPVTTKNLVLVAHQVQTTLTQASLVHRGRPVIGVHPHLVAAVIEFGVELHTPRGVSDPERLVRVDLSGAQPSCAGR